MYSLEICTSCEAGYFLQQTDCVEYCHNEEQFEDSVNNKCVDSCPSNTLTFADGDDKQCLARCPSGFVKYKLDCMEECPLGTYLPSVECFDCANNCMTCLGPLAN